MSANGYFFKARINNSNKYMSKIIIINHYPICCPYIRNLFDVAINLNLGKTIAINFLLWRKPECLLAVNCIYRKLVLVFVIDRDAGKVVGDFTANF